MTIDNKEEFAEILRQFLIEGDEDYIGLFEILGSISHIVDIHGRQNLSPADSEKLLQAVLAFIIVMLKNGFEAVDLLKNGKCTPWPDQSPESVCERITVAWQQTPANTGPLCFSFWFNKINKSPPARN